jgi:hypothetical protein
MPVLWHPTNFYCIRVSFTLLDQSRRLLKAQRLLTFLYNICFLMSLETSSTNSSTGTDLFNDSYKIMYSQP